jgi:hypothetical protein
MSTTPPRTATICPTLRPTVPGVSASAPAETETSHADRVDRLVYRALQCRTAELLRQHDGRIARLIGGSAYRT